MKIGSILVIDDKLVIDYNQNGENKKIALPIDNLIKNFNTNNIGINDKKEIPCIHQQCTLCNGTGRKKDGTICVHHISCNCKKCSISL